MMNWMKSKMMFLAVTLVIAGLPLVASAGEQPDLNAVTQAAVAGAQQKLNEATQRYMAKRDAALEIGTSGPGGVDSKEELQRQRQIIDDFMHTTLEAIAAIQDFEPFIAEKVQADGFPDDAVESVRRSVRGVLDSADLKQKISRMRLDMDWTDAVRERYQLMQDGWGKWHIDATHHQVDSKDSEFIREYNLLSSRILQIEKDANRISKGLSE